jgi:hypothetical protein
MVRISKPIAVPFLEDIQPALREPIFAAATAEREAHRKPNAGDWLRANEMIMGHLSR